MKWDCYTSHNEFDLNRFELTIIYFEIEMILFGIFRDKFDLSSELRQRKCCENHFDSRVGVAALFSFSFFSHLR